jgi:hypothetical protein
MSTKKRKSLSFEKCPQMEFFRGQIAKLYKSESAAEVSSPIISHNPSSVLARLHVEMRDHVAKCPVCTKTQVLRSAEGNNPDRIRS